MNDTISDIIYDDNGNCNYCNEFLERIKQSNFDQLTHSFH